MLTITVNGKKRQVAASPETPLFYVLRNELDIMSDNFRSAIRVSVFFPFSCLQLSINIARIYHESIPKK